MFVLLFETGFLTGLHGAHQAAQADWPELSDTHISSSTIRRLQMHIITPHFLKKATENGKEDQIGSRQALNQLNNFCQFLDSVLEESIMVSNHVSKTQIPQAGKQEVEKTSE